MFRAIHSVCLVSLLLISACSKSPEPDAGSVSKTSSTPGPRAAGFETTESMAKSLLTILKTNDFKKLEAHFMDITDFQHVAKQLLISFAKTKPSKAQLASFHSKIQQQIKSFPNNRATKLAKLKTQFEKMRQQVTALGGDWQSAVYVGKHVANRHSRHGLPMLNLYLTFKSRQKTFVVYTTYCMKTDRGWILTENIVLEGSSPGRKQP